MSQAEKNIERSRADTNQRKLVHFHYDADTDIDLADARIESVTVYFHKEAEELADVHDNACEAICAVLELESGETRWKVHAGWSALLQFDAALHHCLFSRSESDLVDLSALAQDAELSSQPNEELRNVIEQYLRRFCELFGNRLVCSTVLDFLELGPRGNHVTHADAIDASLRLNSQATDHAEPGSMSQPMQKCEDVILLRNEPAIGAAHVIKEYVAQAPDEMSLSVGEMLSVIEMRRGEPRWRGKKQLEKADIRVGYFPADCVQLLGGGKQRTEVEVFTAKDATSPNQRHVGQLLSNLFATRPTKSSLRRSGIMKERVFGCDLGEYVSVLPDAANAVPPILTICSATLERFGVVDGIYRLSGSSSAVQALRSKLDNDDFLVDLLSELRESQLIKQKPPVKTEAEPTTVRKPNVPSESEFEKKIAASVESECLCEHSEVDSSASVTNVSIACYQHAPNSNVTDLNLSSTCVSPSLQADGQCDTDGAKFSKPQSSEEVPPPAASRGSEGTQPKESISRSNSLAHGDDDTERPGWFVDIHSVAAVLKMYFRELPNPLFTFELYSQFQALADQEPSEQLIGAYKLIHQLPPPHYRTARALFKHLHRMSNQEARTNMGSKNLAIVWSPNLLRSKHFLNAPVASTDQSAVLREMANQTLIVELIIRNATLLFGDKLIVFRDGVAPVADLPTADRVLLSISEAQRRHLGKSFNQADEVDSPNHFSLPTEVKAHRSYSSKEKDRVGTAKHTTRRSHVETSPGNETKRETFSFIKVASVKRMSSKPLPAPAQRSRSQSRESHGQPTSASAAETSKKPKQKSMKQKGEAEKYVKEKEKEKDREKEKDKDKEKEKEREKEKEKEKKASTPLSPSPISSSPTFAHNSKASIENEKINEASFSSEQPLGKQNVQAASNEDDDPTDLPRINIRRAIRTSETDQHVASGVSRAQSIRNAQPSPRIAVKRATGSIRQPQRPPPPGGRESPVSGQRTSPDRGYLIGAADVQSKGGYSMKAPLNTREADDSLDSALPSHSENARDATPPALGQLNASVDVRMIANPSTESLNAAPAPAPVNRTSQYVLMPSTITVTEPRLYESVSPISWNDEVFTPMATLENAPVMVFDSNRDKMNEKSSSTN